MLDPAQNHTFRDHYLDVELDLSDVVFLATANVLDTIPGPLLDRMEVIQFDGYTEDEKVAIARDYLLAAAAGPKRPERRRGEVTDEPLRKIAAEYTREAGRAQLERELGKAAAQGGDQASPRDAEARRRSSIGADAGRDYLGRPRFTPGVGRAAPRCPAWPPAWPSPAPGGDVLFVEATRDATARPGLQLTGQLGDVMKESAQIALSYVRGARRRARHRPEAPSRTRRSTCTCPPARSPRTARARASRWSPPWRRCLPGGRSAPTSA